MRPIMLRLQLAAVVIVMFGISGCGRGVDESNFAPKPGSAPPDAPKTPAEYDASTPRAKT